MENFIGNNINAIRIHYGYTQQHFAKIAGVSQTTVSAWECGYTTPRGKTVKKIINEISDLDFDDIMSEENGFAKTVNKRSTKANVNVPLYGSIAAGTPKDMIPVEEYHPIPKIIHDRYPEAFLLKVKGNSMDKILPNNCYALINPTKEIISGKVYAVCCDNETATIKRVKELANGFELVPDSTDPTYKSKIYDYGVEGTEEVKIIGRVVWYELPYDFEI